MISGTVEKKEKKSLSGIIAVAACGMFFLIGIAGLIAMDNGADYSLTEIMTGVSAVDFQKRFDDAVPLKPLGISFWSSLRYSLFKEGFSGVLIGDDGWLFTSEEYETALGDYRIEDNVFNVICDVKEKLEENGIRLFIIPVPSKNRIYKDKTGRYPVPDPVDVRYAGILECLDAIDAEYADLAGTFIPLSRTERLYYKTDTHWTEAGAKLAAALTAFSIDTAIQGTELPVRNFKTERTGETSITGDLITYLPHSQQEEYGTEPLTVIQTVEDDPPVTGLFDAPVIPYALVGTSYSSDRRWGFAGFLKEALHSDVMDVSQEGKGPFAPMEEILQNTVLLDSGVRCVLWEIPERYIPSDDISSFLRDKR